MPPVVGFQVTCVGWPAVIIKLESIVKGLGLLCETARARKELATKRNEARILIFKTLDARTMKESKVVILPMLWWIRVSLQKE